MKEYPVEKLMRDAKLLPDLRRDLADPAPRDRARAVDPAREAARNWL